MTTALVGYDPRQAGGVFTFGGTGAMLYAVKIGLEKALPGSRQHGLREPAAVLASDCSHYSAVTVASWLGLGEESVTARPYASRQLDQSGGAGNGGPP